jgi:hypothetical protein
MRGLDPRIHHLRKNLPKWMDCRVKPGNDEWKWHHYANTPKFFAARQLRQ